MVQGPRRTLNPAAILAGGRSLRMGCDKATMDFGGQPLARSVHNVLANSGCNPVYIVGRQPELHTLQMPVLSDEDSISHPFSGVITALEYFDDHLVLFCPVDLAALNVDDVRLILDFGAPCVASAGDQVQPLLCLIGPKQIPIVKEILSNRGPAHALSDTLPRVQIRPQGLINCNERKDFESIATSGRLRLSNPPTRVHGVE